MEMKLELVPVPVIDIDRAKAFYTDMVGLILDLDVRPSDGMRVVQLTPPGSACSIVIGTGLGGISDMTPGILNLRGCTLSYRTSTGPATYICLVTVPLSRPNRVKYLRPF